VGLFDTHVRIRFVWKDLSPGGAGHTGPSRAAWMRPADSASPEARTTRAPN